MLASCTVSCPACGAPVRLTGTVTESRRDPDTRTVHTTIACDDGPWLAHAAAHHTTD